MTLLSPSRHHRHTPPLVGHVQLILTFIGINPGFKSLCFRTALFQLPCTLHLDLFLLSLFHIGVQDRYLCHTTVRSSEGRIISRGVGLAVRREAEY